MSTIRNQSSSPLPTTYKICFVGDGGSGKTSYLLNRLYGLEFSTKYLPTIGADVYAFRTSRYVANIWDTAGLEKSENSLNSHYYIGSDAIVVVSDDPQWWINRVKKTFLDDVPFLVCKPLEIPQNIIDDAVTLASSMAINNTQ